MLTHHGITYEMRGDELDDCSGESKYNAMHHAFLVVTVKNDRHWYGQRTTTTFEMLLLFFFCFKRITSVFIHYYEFYSVFCSLLWPRSMIVYVKY